MMADLSLQYELDVAIKSGKFDIYVQRAQAESELFELGESCDWERETMIQYCLAGPSGFLGREMFERSFDSGAMKTNATIYHNSLLKWRQSL